MTPPPPPDAPGVALLVSNLKTGGAERNAVDLACALPRQGIRPLVLVADESGPLEHVLRKAGVPVEFLNAERWRPKSSPAFWRNLFTTARRIRVACAAHRCAVIHAFLFWENPLAMLALRRGGFPRRLVTGRLNLGHWKAGRPHYQVIENAINLRTDAVVGNSLGVYAACHDQERFLGEKMRVIYNGIATERFRDAAPVDLGERYPALADAEAVAICVANLRPEKRHDVWLRALAEARQSAPGLKGLLAGRDSGEQGKVEALIRELGLEGAVVLAGSVDDPAPLLRAADLFLLTSDTEGLPTALAEAMAAGLPVISTPAGGVPEIVADGETGLIVPFRDAGAAAQAMVRLVRDAALRERLAAAGQEFALRRFDLDAHAAAHGRLYRALAAGGALPPGADRTPVLEAEG
ncbi:MAG: glycosyltransferase [Sumerlaeia bacterium]